MLDAGRHLASSANKKAVRLLAGEWGVQQVGGVNRGTTDILNEVQVNVRRAAMRLLQKEEVREEGAGAVAREGYAAEVSVSQGGSEAVDLRACWRILCPLRQGLLVANQSAEKQKVSISTSATPAQHHHQHHHQH